MPNLARLFMSLATLASSASLLPAGTVFLGTYSSPASRGIYTTTLDSGTLSTPRLLAPVADPTFLALTPDHHHLYCVSRADQSIYAFTLAADGSAQSLGRQPSATANPVHLVVDPAGRFLATACYEGGGVSLYPLSPDGTPGPDASTARVTYASGANPKRQSAPHIHGVAFSPDGAFLYAPDLGADRVYAWRVAATQPCLAPLSPAFLKLPAGHGPRHLAFSPDGHQACLINELANTLTVLAFDSATGALSIVQDISTLPAGFDAPSTAAEVVFSPSGRTVYASNRGADTIAVFARDPATGHLSPLQQIPSGGRAPRSFALSPDGRWLITAHQDSNDLFLFAVDPATGKLTPTGRSISLGKPVCVLFD